MKIIFYLELQPNTHKEQITVNRELLKLSKEMNVPYIITTDSHYLKKKIVWYTLHFLNLKMEIEVADFYATTYMMTTEELEEYFENRLTNRRTSNCLSKYSKD